MIYLAALQANFKDPFYGSSMHSYENMLLAFELHGIEISSLVAALLLTHGMLLIVEQSRRHCRLASCCSSLSSCSFHANLCHTARH